MLRCLVFLVSICLGWGCDEAMVKQCRETPTMDDLLVKDPSCDQQKIQDCFNKHVDMSALADKSKRGDLCRTFSNFKACYESARLPCMSSADFASSQPELIYNQISLICRSTETCDLIGIAECESMLYSAYAMSSLIPNSGFLSNLCGSYTAFVNCSKPKMESCLLEKVNPDPMFLGQAQYTHMFVDMVCNKQQKFLMKHTTSCYDNEELQKTLEQTCTNPINNVLMAGTPDEDVICKDTYKYLKCINKTLAVGCQSEAAGVTAAGYAESWMMLTLTNMMQITCQPFGFVGQEPPASLGPPPPLPPIDPQPQPLPSFGPDPPEPPLIPPPQPTLKPEPQPPLKPESQSTRRPTPTKGLPEDGTTPPRSSTQSSTNNQPSAGSNQKPNIGDTSTGHIVIPSLLPAIFAFVSCMVFY